jgi:hypothetical protein
MGLFRRGTKLLRLGSGLRDCCCRPEQPEECWCPDPCVFYWSWGGSRFFPAKEYPLDLPCDFGRIGGEFYEADRRDSFGLIDGDLDAYSSASGNPGTIEGGTTFGVVGSSLRVGNLGGPTFAEVGYGGSISGPLSYAAEEEIFGRLSGYEGSLGVGQAFYSWSSYIYIGCRNDANGVPQFLLYAFINTYIAAEQVIDYRFSGGFDTDADAVYDQRIIFNGFLAITGSDNITGDGVVLSLDSECTPASELQCNGPTRAMKRMISELQLSIDSEGVYVNEQLFPWEVELFGTPVDNRGLTELWKIDGQDPTGFSAILKMKDSCQPGDCDCEVDLTGRTVVFKGKTFTYGSGDEFTSDDGSEFWEESPTGVFRKVTYDACDVSQQFIALEETAEIICSETIEEGQFWAVFFTVECRERDACGGAFDRSRTTLFNGIFTCDSEGFPSGTPTVELANDELSDPAPTGDCASFPAAPSINFT